MVHGNGWDLFELAPGATELIQGDPAAVNGMAMSVGVSAGMLHATVGQMDALALAAASGWTGAVADAFGDAWGTLGPPTRALADDAVAVDEVLARWSGELTARKSQANRLRLDAMAADDDLDAALAEEEAAAQEVDRTANELQDLHQTAALYAGDPTRADTYAQVRSRITMAKDRNAAAMARLGAAQAAIAEARGRLRQAQASGADLLAEHLDAAAAVAAATRAHTPSMRHRVPFAGQGGLPSGPMAVIAAAFNDSFITRALELLDESDPEWAAKLRDRLSAAVAIVVMEPEELGLASEVADTASSIGATLGWVVIAAAGTIILVTVTVGTGGVGGAVVAGATTVGEVASTGVVIAGATEMAAGAAAGEGEHVAAGFISVMTSAGPVRIPVAGSADDIGREAVEEILTGVAGQAATTVVLQDPTEATPQDLLEEIDGQLDASSTPSHGPAPVEAPPAQGPPSPPAHPPGWPLAPVTAPAFGEPAPPPDGPPSVFPQGLPTPDAPATGPRSTPTVPGGPIVLPTIEVPMADGRLMAFRPTDAILVGPAAADVPVVDPQGRELPRLTLSPPAAPAAGAGAASPPRSR